MSPQREEAQPPTDIFHPAPPKDPEFLDLTTTGRRSGQPREIEIWFARRGERYSLIAERGARALGEEPAR